MSSRPGARKAQGDDIDLRVVDPAGADAVWAMTQYFDELDRRFPTGFDPGDTLVADAPNLQAPEGAFVVAYDGARPVACGGVQAIETDVGEIKRMWVDPASRGLGLGKRMLARLEVEARALRHRLVRLDTNSELTEAIAMYEANGYRPIERYNDNPYAKRWFEKEL